MFSIFTANLDGKPQVANMSQWRWGDIRKFVIRIKSIRTESFEMSKTHPLPIRAQRKSYKMVDCLHDHLLAGKQGVANELASPQGNGSVGHFGGVVVMRGEESWRGQ